MHLLQSWISIIETFFWKGWRIQFIFVLNYFIHFLKIFNLTFCTPICLYMIIPTKKIQFPKLSINKNCAGSILQLAKDTEQQTLTS